jgi:glycosyltransferase involved in cell wall biosynthesis
MLQNRMSIITICFNNLDEVMATCKSVDEQTIPPFEHLIINGSTKCDIQDWLLQNKQPSYRRWLNERDNGIADAFNKGVRMSQGDILLMLNSADTLANTNVLHIVRSKFEADPSLMWLHGMYQYQRAGIWVTLGKPFEVEKVYRGMRSICHQTMYVKKTLHEKYGLYNTHLNIAMDFDFLVRIRTEKFAFIPEVLAIFAPGGTSMQNMQKILDENTKIIETHLGKSIRHRLWTWRLKLLIGLMNSPLGKPLFWLKTKLGLANA